MFLVTKSFDTVNSISDGTNYKTNFTQLHVISFSYHKKGKQEVICQSEEMRAICVPSGKWTTIFTDELTKVIL